MNRAGTKVARRRRPVRAAAFAVALSVVSAPGRASPTERAPLLAGTPRRAPRSLGPASPDAPGRWHPGFAMRALTLRASVDAATRDAERRTAGSGAVEELALAYLTKGWLTARYTDTIALGYGSGGLVGALGADAAMGIRPPVGERHGPVLRLGLRGHLRADGTFRSSLAELPQLQLGYTFLGRDFQVELAGRGGAVLGGRFAAPGVRSRHLGHSLEVGGHLGLGFRPIRVDLELRRTALSPGELRPIDDASLLLCAALPRKKLCLRGATTLTSARIPGGPITDVRATYVGVGFGVGPVDWR